MHVFVFFFFNFSSWIQTQEELNGDPDPQSCILLIEANNLLLIIAGIGTYKT